jgi:hypothetical protein
MPGVTRGLLLRAGASTLCVAMLALLGGSVLAAKPTKSWQLTRPSTPVRLAKLDGRLRAVALAQAARGAAAARAAAAGARVTATSQGMVVVIEPATRLGAAEDAVRAAGGTVGVHADGLIEARVPADRLGALAESSAVARVRAPALHMPDAITGEGVEASDASAWHAAGFSGAGVKVGVIDLGFAGYAARLGTELPASVTAKDFCGGLLAAPPPLGEVHGTAVAEIVHEVAPGAQLYLICIDSEVGLASAVAYAKAQGITIVNHSVSWFGTSRGDGTGGPGTPDAIVADARQSGILWANSAGNQARAHWSGGWSDPDGDGAMAPTGAFSVGAGAGACVMLRWDAWPATTQDYDLYLVRGATVVSASVAEQADQPSEPFEAACWLNSSSVTAFVTPVVVDYSAPFFAGTLDYFVLGGSLLGGAPPGSLTEPASSPSTVAVGATCWSQLTPTSYSSRGPTIDGRTKPELLAPDSVSGSTYGSGGCETSGFAGTSAAAPHVAGAAALLKQRTPSATPGQLLTLLQANTVRTAGAGDPGALWLRRPITGTPLVYNQDGQVTAANADASGTHRILSRAETSAAPAFSPDGTKVAYATNVAGNWKLAVADADGSNERVLAASSESGPAWRPDGAKILFAATRNGTPGLFTINPDGTGETRLTSTPASDPDYAPSGSIVFMGVASDVYTANGDGSGVTNLTNGVPSSVNERPAFSPDGSKIVFATGPAGGELYVMKTDGSELTRLTTTAAFETDPAWSPDGKITFARREAGGTDFDLFTMNADGTGQARLLRSPFTVDRAPDWAQTPAAAPLAWALPAISGEPRAGRWLTATAGSWQARVPFTTSFSWLRCDAAGGACTAIAGATDSNYGIGVSDVGSTIRVRLTADDGTATTSAQSDATQVIRAGAPQNLSLPSISGQATVGSTLTASPGSWSGAPSALLYQWLRCDLLDGCVTIPGATGAAYVPVAGDAGLGLRVAVRAVHPDGLSAGFTVATSLAVTVRAGSSTSPPPPAPSAPPPGAAAAATDAALQVTANAQSVARGDTVTFRLTVVNQHATGVATGLRVSYAIPVGAQLLAWPIQCVGGATFSCELGSLAPQQSTSVEFKVRLNELGTTGNVFTVTTTESDTDPADNQATVTIVVATKPATQLPRGVRKTGTARRDVLVGTRFDDVLGGLGGNDVLRGLAGNDLLYGGAGSDTVEGGAGNDLLAGGPGRDTIRCGAGKDRVTADRRDRVAKDCERVRR